MTDADQLLSAYFRQEFQITPMDTKVLLALYNAHTLSLSDIMQRFDLKRQTASVYLVRLRHALGSSYITPIPTPGRGDPTKRYAISPHGREEINRMLRIAVTDLSQRLGLGRIAA